METSSMTATVKLKKGMEIWKIKKALCNAKKKGKNEILIYC